MAMASWCIANSLDFDGEHAGRRDLSGVRDPEALMSFVQIADCLLATDSDSSDG